MNWPRLRPARPTLRGLLVDGDSPIATTHECVLYPWNRIGRTARHGGVSVWTVYDADGRDRTDGRRRVQLKVTGKRSNQLAAAAQNRRFRQDWRDGRLDLTEQYDAGRRDAFKLTVMLLLCGILLAAMIVVPAAKAWRSEGLSQFDNEHRTLLLATCLMWALVSAAPLAIAAWLIITGAARPNVREARLDSDGLRARLLDGTEVTGSWSDLGDIRCEQASAIVQFAAGPPLRFWLTRNPRTRVALAVIRNHFHPEAALRRRQSQRRALARCGVYTIAGGLALAAAVYRYGRDDLTPGERLAAAMTVALIGGIAGLAFLILPDRMARPSGERD